MVTAEATDDATLVVTFAAKRGRDVPLFVASLPIFSQAYYASASVRRIDARYSARQRAVQGRPVRGRTASSNSTGSRTGGAPTCRSAAAATISTWCDTNSIATATWRFEGFTGRELSVPRRVHLAHLGDALRFSGDARRAASSASSLPDETPSGAQGWFINTRRDKFKDPRVREALDRRLRFRVDQQDHHVRRL